MIKVQNPCLLRARYRRVIIIIPCAVVTSLETDAFMVIVACFMVRGNPARGREEGTQGSVAFLNERKKRPRLCISKLGSNEFYSTESWRIGIERFGETHLKFPGCIWHETKFEKEKVNLEALSKKVNLMSEILARPVLRNEHLRKPHYKQVVPAN